MKYFLKNRISLCVLEDAEMEVDDELVDIVVNLAEGSTHAAGKPLFLGDACMELQNVKSYHTSLSHI